MKQQQRKEQAEALLEGLVDWRSGKAAETSEKIVEKEFTKAWATKKNNKVAENNDQQD